ncbi:MAG: hypothetical protein ACKOQ4_07640 [Mycobacterium sp.]
MVATVYAAAALVAASAIFLAADSLGHGLPRPPHRFIYSVLAGLLWPLLAVGLAEFAVIAAIRHRGSGGRQPAAAMADVEADTGRASSLAGVP